MMIGGLNVISRRAAPSLKSTALSLPNRPSIQNRSPCSIAGIGSPCRVSSRSIFVPPSPSSRLQPNAEPSAGGNSGDLGGGNTGGGNGGNGNDWGSSEDGDEESGFGANVWILLAFAASALGVFGAYQKFKPILAEQVNTMLPSKYDSDDVRTLKRLLKEVFSDLVQVRGRLDELETATGVSSLDFISDATPLNPSSVKQPGTTDARSSSSSRTPSPRQTDGAAAPRTRSAIGGVLKIGGGLLWEDDASGLGLDSVQDTGVRLGTDLILRLGGAVRGGRDAVMAEVCVDPGEENFALQKILYSCKVAPGLRAILAPFGARGQDVAYTLNPLAGQGLTSSVKHGNPLHQKLLGSVIGAAADLKRAWLSLGYFSQTGEDGTVQDTILAQAVIAPIPAISLGVTVLEPGENFLGGDDGLLTAGALGSARGSLPSARGSARSSRGGGAASIVSQREYGAMVAVAGGNFALHGWATADTDTVETKAWHDVQWGLTLGPRPDGSGNGWSLGVGKVTAVGPGLQSIDPVEALQPNMVELSTQWNLGEGMLLTPGVVVLRKDGKSTIFAGVKTAWMF